MGLLQPDVGHRRGDGETYLKPIGKAVTVISLVQAKAALAAAEALETPVTLMSAPGAAANVGAGWFDAVVSLARDAYPSVSVAAVLDCGDAPGHALAALRHGFKFIRYSGPNQREIEEIAEGYEASVLTERPDTIELESDVDDVAILDAACRTWLKNSCE